MSIKICIYKGHTKSCINHEDISPLENIPQLPWANNDRYCIGGRAPRYTNCQHIKWKLSSSKTQIVPSNSRPVPLRRNWHAPGRPLPSLSDDPNCDITAGPCDIDMNNTPLSSEPPIMNDEEYLSYNNPSHINGKVWFYNGPGWKISRVHGKSKSRALPRPIKHWRKQLFPRQKLDVATGQPFPPILPPAGTSLDNTSGGRMGRLSVIDRPGGAITIDSHMVTQLYEAGDFNNTSCIPLYFPTSQQITSCDLLREVEDCVQSLKNTRPGVNIKFNKYSFTSSKMYLQSRAKLHEQQATIQYNRYSNLPVLGWQGAIIAPPNPSRPLPPSSVSLYLKDSSGCFISTDCSCVVPVSFKPRNTAFARDTAVSSSTNIKRKKRSAITRNQYNVTNKWGFGNNDTIKDWPMEEFKTRGKRRGGGALSSWCCDNPNKFSWDPIPPLPPPPPDTFTVSIEESLWFNYLDRLIKATGLSPTEALWKLLPIRASLSNKTFLNGNDLLGNLIFYIFYTDIEPLTQAKEDAGFTMYDTLETLKIIYESEYPLNIIKWGGIPFVANTSSIGYHFSIGEDAEPYWNGKNIASDIPTLKPTTSLKSSFEGVSIPSKDFGNLGDWNTTNVISLQNTFYNAISFNQDIGDWNTSNVTDMSGTFYNATYFNQDIGDWITTNVIDMSGTFYKATAFDQNLAKNPEISWRIDKLKYASHMLDYCGMSMDNYTKLIKYWGDNSKSGAQSDVSFGAVDLVLDTTAATIYNPVTSVGIKWRGKLTNPISNNAPWQNTESYFLLSYGNNVGAYSSGFVTDGQEWTIRGDYMNNDPNVFISDIKLVYGPPPSWSDISQCEPCIWSNMSYKMFSQIFGYIPTSVGFHPHPPPPTSLFNPDPNSESWQTEGDEYISPNPPNPPPEYPAAYADADTVPVPIQGTTNYIKIILDADTGPREPSRLPPGAPPDPPADPTSKQDFNQLVNKSFQCDLNYGPLGLQGPAGPNDTSYNWWYPPRDPTTTLNMVDICDGFIPVVNASPYQMTPSQNNLIYNTPSNISDIKPIWQYLTGYEVDNLLSISPYTITDGASSMFGLGNTYRVTEFRIESSIALIPNTSGAWPLTPGPQPTGIPQEEWGNHIDVHIKGYRTLVDVSGISQRQPVQARLNQTQPEWVFNSRYIDAPDTYESGFPTPNASRDWIQTALADNSGVAICQPQGTDISSVFITKDAGVTWQALKTQPKSINVIDLSCVCVTVEGFIVIAGFDSINSKLCLARCKDAFTSSPVWESCYIVENPSAQATGYWTALAYNNSDENYWAATLNNTASEFWEGKYGESSRNKSWASSSPSPSFDSTNFKWTSISIATPPSEYPHAMKVAFAGNGGADTSGCAVPLLAWRNKYNEIWNFTLCPWRASVGDAPQPNYGVGFNVLFKKVYSKPNTVYSANSKMWLIDFLFFTVIVTSNSWGNMTKNDEIICVTEWPDTTSGTQGFGNGIPTIPLSTTTSQYPSIYKKGGINTANMSPDSANFYPNGVVSSISASPDSTNIVWVTTSNYIFNILTSAAELCDTGNGGQFGKQPPPQGFKWIYPTDTDPGFNTTPHPNSGNSLPKTTLSTSASVPALPQFTGGTWNPSGEQMRSVSMYAFGRTLLPSISVQSNPLYTTPWSDTSLNVVLFTNYQTDLPNLWSGKVLNVAKN